MPRARGVAEQHGDFSAVPRLGVCDAGEHRRLGELLKDALLVVLVGVEDQQIVSRTCVGDLFESLELGVVDRDHVALVVVDRAVRHLKELTGQRRRHVSPDRGGHLVQRLGVVHVQLGVAVLLLQQRNDLVALKLLVPPPRLAIQLHADRVVHGLGPVGVCNGQAQVAQLTVNRGLRPCAQFPLVDDVSLVRAHREVARAVFAHCAPEMPAPVQQVHLRPEVQISVRRGRAGQADHVAHLLDCLLDAAPALRALAFEAGELVDDDHVIRQHALQLIHEPHKVVPPDDVQISGLM